MRTLPSSSFLLSKVLVKALTVVILQVTISLLEAAMRDSGKRKFLIDGAGLHVIRGKLRSGFSG